ncbi:Poly (ADP-ribose) polymerase [Desmophyllum pertusum]|uniref:Poly [ADP-ribose] polymerase n=1 Tax=Desmophyllum pertusum TaxID=174260 RepID=A0A9W9YPG4_9CNID|nr:Poly (ADP-ribose) polymerase [Desmophyllum pertusum]
MPRDDRGNVLTVHMVTLESSSSEYQDVVKRFQQTLGFKQNIVSVERIQNPFLYQAYQLRKQKMESDNGGNSERQLFHGTNPDNITKINMQGFDRSFSGSAHGLCSAVYGYVGLCGAMYGYVGLCSAVYGYVALCSAVYGYVVLCGAVYGYVGFV